MYNCGSDYLDDAMYKIHGLFPLGNTQNQPVNLYAVSFGFDYCAEPAEGDTSRAQARSCGARPPSTAAASASRRRSPTSSTRRCAKRST
jgi:hypothetical protein